MGRVQKNNNRQTVRKPFMLCGAVERALSLWVLFYESTPTFEVPFQTTDVSAFTRSVALRVRNSVALP